MLEFSGSIAKALNGTSGNPAAAMLQVGGLAFRFVVFQTCCPAIPKPEKATYAVLELLGSITARETYLAGMAALRTFVSGFAPVVVAKMPPFLRPTMRTLSFCREMPMALTAMPAWNGPWLTRVMVVPWLAERYSRS